MYRLGALKGIARYAQGVGTVPSTGRLTRHLVPSRGSGRRRPMVTVMPRTRLYRNGVLEAEGFPIAEVSDHLEDESATIWFDLCKPTEAELATVSEELGLHPLAIEDAVNEHQRPKLDRYASHPLGTAY